MTIYTLNPTKINNDSSIILEYMYDLIYSNSHTSFIKKGVYPLSINNKLIEIELTHNLLIRNKEKKYGKFRVEVLEDSPFSSGGFSTVYYNLGVLVPENNYSFKEKSIDKERITKKIGYSLFSTRKHIEYECFLTQKYNIKLKCKTAILDKTQGFLVMRRTGDLDLQTFIYLLRANEIEYTDDRLLQLTINIIKVIKELHDLGGLHCDIKPENIMVDSESLEVSLIDYAYAHSIKKDPISFGFNLLYGTLEYLAPEIIYSFLTDHETENKWKHRTVKSDSFALGLTIAMLWGLDSDIFTSDERDLNLIYEHHISLDYKNLSKNIILCARQKAILLDVFNGLTQFNPAQRISAANAFTKCNALKVSKEVKLIPCILSSSTFFTTSEVTTKGKGDCNGPTI